MTLRFRAMLHEENPAAERRQVTYWSEKKRAEDWARAVVAGSPDPEAFVTIDELIERNAEIIKKETNGPSQEKK